MSEPRADASPSEVEGAGAPLTLHGAVSWLRRAVSIPLYAVLWSILVLAAPLLFPLAAVVDLTRRRPWPTVRCLAFFATYLTCEVLGIAASFGLWALRGPRTGCDPIRYQRANFVLQCWWARALLRGAERVFSMRTEVEGDDAVASGPLLLFIRHASVGDTVLPANLISDRHGIMLRYVLKRELLWDPCLDIVGNRLPNYFVHRGSGDSGREIAAIQQLVDNLGERDGVLIYPEGTRFSAAKRAHVLERLRRAGDEALHRRAAALRHVLPPRLGGPLGLLRRNRRADVVFCAHVGFEGAGAFKDFVAGSLVGQRIRVRFWRVAFAEIPRNAAEQREWLLDWWDRIDEWIDGHLAAPRKAAE